MRGIAPTSLTVALVLIAIVAITHDSGHYVLTAIGPVAFIGIGTTGDPRPTESSSTEENPSRKSLGEPACLARALSWIEQGADVIPLAPDLVADPKTGKLDPQPTVKWARSNDHTLKTEDEVRHHHSAHPYDQLGIRLGEGHGGRRLLCVDVDVKHYTDGKPPDGRSEPRPFEQGYDESTKSGGRHHVCAIKTPLAPGTNAREQGLGGFVDVLADGLLVVAPTRFGNAPRAYEVLTDAPLPEFDSVRQALEASADWLYPEWKARHSRTPRSDGGAAPRMTPAKDLDEVRARLRGNDAGRLAERILKDTSGETRSRNLCLVLLGHLLAAGATPEQATELLNCATWSSTKIAKLKPTVPAGVDALRTYAEGVAASEALLVEKDARTNPWSSERGWETEPEIPILTETKRITVVDKSGKSNDEETKVAVEPGYVVFNDMVTERRLRVFRTKSGEPRVAFPTLQGVEVLDPSSEGFSQALGYRFWTRVGKKVPLRDLGVAARAMTERAYSADLPLARVVDLSIRIAPAGPNEGLLDLVDTTRRCVRFGPDGWGIESLSMPVFERPGHMAPLPLPLRATGKDGDWTRVNEIFTFMAISLPDPDDTETEQQQVERKQRLDRQRLLVLVSLVQALLRSRSTKPIPILNGDDGSGKSHASGKLAGVLDPSIVQLVPVPANEQDVLALALNRNTVAIDNVSYIEGWFSDALARLTTGIGFAKRRLYYDRDEVVSRLIPRLILNGFTALPRNPDLIRRALFLWIVRPGKTLGDEEYEKLWSDGHPAILGGLLDLTCLTAKVLRDRPPEGTGDSMADFTRVGRAVAVAMGREATDFDMAWKENGERQAAVASENPWIPALCNAFEDLKRGVLGDSSGNVTPEQLAKFVSEHHRESFPKGVSSQVVGNWIAAARGTLRAFGYNVEKRRGHGGSRFYYLSTPKKGVTAVTQQKLPSEKQGDTPGDTQGDTKEAGVTPTVTPKTEVSPPCQEENPTDFSSENGPLGDRVTTVTPSMESGAGDPSGTEAAGQPRTRAEVLARARAAFNVAAREEGLDP